MVNQNSASLLFVVSNVVVHHHYNVFFRNTMAKQDVVCMSSVSLKATVQHFIWRPKLVLTFGTDVKLYIFFSILPSMHQHFSMLIKRLELNELK